MANNRIIFFGTSEFAVPALEKFVEAGMRPVLVVTTPDAPAGRTGTLTPPPVKVAVNRLGLEIFQPATLKTPEVLSALRRHEPDVGILAAYGKIIPEAVIELFPKGILNVHPSLLPRWRGATPIQAAILAGDEKTGVTIILLDEDVDHGPILAQRELRIENRESGGWTYETLHAELSRLGAELLVKTLPQWLAESLSPAPQDHGRATFCKKFTRDDAKIDWSKSAEAIDRMVRALNPEPGTWAEMRIENKGSRILKILQAKPFLNSQEFENRSAGEIFEFEKSPVVKCGSGVLMLERVQPEGKKSMSGEAFLRGYSIRRPASSASQISFPV